ncbi:intraflagellar transport protein 74 homolog [Diaphorina citri]|uniref:Intraflagellar transport protein 74 homolog n=1 Tax=Diaphorina citri TaxID=121845 RepID=A0A1S3DMG6_DIACI|nr:intraflagellar transport protein 74 homolog [Diaphorina citri]
MDPDLKNGYLELQAKHKALLHQMDTAQEQVDTLSYQTAVLREKMSGSSVKLEAVQLYEQLAELEEQYNALLEEEESKLNPEQEREKLLLQIKNDNYEISNAEANMQTVENQIKEAEAQLEQLNQSQLDQKISYIQLSNQEKRLAQIEQTNYTLDEFIKNKLSETNFVPVKDKCVELVEGYNRLLKVSYQDTVHG